MATLAELLWLMNERLMLEAEPVDWGHDVTLNQSNLALSLDDRVRRGVVFSRRMAEIRGATSRERA